ncbi:Envelope glycoprotein B, partial [Dissostichus eleginoides]
YAVVPETQARQMKAVVFEYEHVNEAGVLTAILSAPLTQLLAGGVIHGPDRCLVQLDLSLIIPKAWTALSFTIAQIIS